MEHAVGIDLGTTYSAVAIVGPDGKPVVVTNSDGRNITPSVICFKDGNVIVGQEAKDLQGVGEWPVAIFFKREMGDPDFLFEAGGNTYTATDLSTIVLRKLKSDAEAKLGYPISGAVITVPAYFRDRERKATIAAGRAAGLNVLQVINEPTAAAVSYGLDYTGKDRKIMVYDLGGGTFDVTLLELGASGVAVMTSDGDHHLGGQDWDGRILEFLVSRFQDEHGIDPFADSDGVADMYAQAEQAKKRLTSFESTEISIVACGRRGRYTLDRSKFEEITADLLERTAMLTKKILADMRLQPSDVDGVVLVGGSTRMPMVHCFVERHFGKKPLCGVNVDEAVALGAAVVANRYQAPSLPGSTAPVKGFLRMMDVTNHSMGMIAVNADQSAYVSSLILPKNRRIPCTDTRPYQYRTRRHGANRLEIFMTQGESESPAVVSYIGLYVIENIPHQESGIAVVEVSYHYDISGTVSVTARLKGDGVELPVKLEPLPPDVPDRFLGKPPTAGVPENVVVYMAFDMSGSMSGSPIREAQRAAKGFLENIDLGHCSVGIIAFSDSALTKLEACQNAGSIERAIDDLRVGETGGCNAADPFDEVYRLLHSVRTGKRIAVILTDGCWQHQKLAIERAQMCHADNIEVIAIGFGGADKQFLDKIASSPDGSLLTSMEGLFDAFSTVAQVITCTDGGLVHEGAASQQSKPKGWFAALNEVMGR